MANGEWRVANGAGFRVLAFAFCLGVAAAHAQSYPVKPVRIVVPQAPGAQSELFARMLGQKLGESLGQPVISDPRPGAAGPLRYPRPAGRVYRHRGGSERHHR